MRHARRGGAHRPCLGIEPDEWRTDAAASNPNTVTNTQADSDTPPHTDSNAPPHTHSNTPAHTVADTSAHTIADTSADTATNTGLNPDGAADPGSHCTADERPHGATVLRS